jgi:hypothetical protein
LFSFDIQTKRLQQVGKASKKNNRRSCFYHVDRQLPLVFILYLGDAELAVLQLGEEKVPSWLRVERRSKKLREELQWVVATAIPRQSLVLMKCRDRDYSVPWKSWFPYYEMVSSFTEIKSVVTLTLGLQYV